MECSNADVRLANIALQEARKSPIYSRHGCLAVVSGKIMARGYNSYQTYSKDDLIRGSCSCHAEINVLRKCLKRNISGKINLYIVRVSNNNIDMVSSAPCLDCVNVMKSFNIKTIVYSENNNHLIKISFKDYKIKHITSGSRAILENRVELFKAS